MRVSGPNALTVLERMAGLRPSPRRASYRALRDNQGDVLDHALIFWFPGPATATGEDLVEFHLHGGRAVVAAVLAAILSIEGTRIAQAGEFTRRAFENGRIDLAEAEGLADLLAAETESQRQSALALAEGGLGKRVAKWQSALLSLSAHLESELDFSDEDDVAIESVEVREQQIRHLTDDMRTMIDAPGVERLKDGVRVVLAGPPNSGKSSLFNCLIDREGAIVSHLAGTTRDRIEAPVALDGVPLILIDTAGLRASDDEIETIGVARAEEAIATADLVLWLGKSQDAPDGAIDVVAKSDIGEEPARSGAISVSTLTGDGVAELKLELLHRVRSLLPKPGALSLNQRHRAILAVVLDELDAALCIIDPLIVAEHLRTARSALDRLTGRAGVEDMLDALFGTMCIGK